VDPILHASRNESELPNVPSPYTDNELPNRNVVRIESELPTLTKSKTESELPNREIPYTDSDEPILVNCLILKVLPT
jgi:hypothetical protein